MYYVNSDYGDEIKPVDVVKQTKCFVFYEGQCFGRPRLWRYPVEQIFETWHKAKDYLVSRIMNKLEQQARVVERLEARLQAIKDMEETN